MAQQGNHQSQQGPIIVFFIIIGLLIGTVFREINKRTKIPYTPMILLIGILLGEFESSLGIWGESADLLEDISPHMILLIFIPVLIFQSAFNCEWHVFKKSLGNILLLAGPGVLIGSALNAVCLKVILRYTDDQMSWFHALTLGCILSATDPVAVVALLKQLGASARFNTLVEGESLMNDGSAMVFFTLFLQLSKGQQTTAGKIVVSLLRTAGGGALLGVVMGILVSFWVKRIIRDSILSMTVTFVAAYLTFYLAQFTVLKVSGILSLVCFGLYMAAVGKRTIYPTSDYALHKVWSFIQYLSETLIFLLTGVIVGIVVVNSSTTISGWDWGRIFIFWILIIITRCFMVVILYPMLTRCGYGLTRRQMVILIYGGLRGSLGLSLSLIVALDGSLPQRFRQLTVFYTCAIAVLTIIINGLTCGKLVDALGMINYPHIKRKLLSKCVRDVLHNAQNKFRHLKQEPSVAYANWRDVQILSQLQKLGIYEVQDDSDGQVGVEDIDQIETSEMVEEIRFRFNRYMQKLAWQLFDNCEITDTTIDLLSEICEVVNDDLSSGLLYWELLSKNFSMITVPLLIAFKDVPLINRFCKRKLIAMIYTVYETTTTFIQIAEETIHVFSKSFPLHVTHLNFVLKEVKDNLQEAVAYSFELENNYPEIIKAVHTKKAASIILDHKSFVLKQMHKQGFIDDNDFQKLRKQLSEKIIQLRHKHFELGEIRFNQLLAQCPLFSSLPSSEIDFLMREGVEQIYTDDTVIIKKQENIQYAYFILSGSIQEQFDGFYFRKGVGTVANPYDLFYDNHSNATVYAVTEAVVLKVKKTQIFKLLNRYSKFKDRWMKTIFPYSLKIYGSHDFHHMDFTQRQLRRFIETSQIVFLQANKTLKLPHGGYVFYGRVQSEDKEYDMGSFLPGRCAITSLDGESGIFKFESPQGLKSRIHKISHLYKADNQILH